VAQGQVEQGGNAQGRASDIGSEGPPVSDAARGNFGQKAGDSQYKGQFNKKGQFKKKGGGGEQ
jgi:hypothetical protein